MFFLCHCIMTDVAAQIKLGFLENGKHTVA